MNGGDGNGIIDGANGNDLLCVGMRVMTSCAAARAMTR
jgi:hypothetical protein